MEIGKKDDEINHHRKKKPTKRQFKEAGALHKPKTTDI